MFDVAKLTARTHAGFQVVTTNQQSFPPVSNRCVAEVLDLPGSL